LLHTERRDLQLVYGSGWGYSSWTWCLLSAINSNECTEVATVARLKARPMPLFLYFNPNDHESILHYIQDSCSFIADFQMFRETLVTFPNMFYLNWSHYTV